MKWTLIWKGLFVGYGVLLVAIGMNAMAMGIGLTTWYGFFEDPAISLVDGGFLFVIYPLTLGAAALAADRVWEFRGGKRR